MAEIIRNRTIRPSSRKEVSKSYKIDTSKVLRDDTLVVNIDHESSSFQKTYTFTGQSVAGKNSISFRVKDEGMHVDITWSKVNPFNLNTGKLKVNEKIKPTSVKEKKAITFSIHHKIGLAPIAYTNSKILILGTMPGEQSLAKQEYYAHPRNLLWKIIATIAGKTMPLNYTEKKELLKTTGIALWDVCDACVREGSLDHKIIEEIPNDLENFLKQHTEIKTIVFNGGKATALFDKYFTRNAKYKYLNMPSTSPANVGMSWSQKINEWKLINLKIRTDA